ncbi:MAG: hypothetical protein WBW78_21435 [Terrimicrobiaceae bacterium]
MKTPLHRVESVDFWRTLRREEPSQHLFDAQLSRQTVGWDKAQPTPGVDAAPVGAQLECCPTRRRDLDRLNDDIVACQFDPDSRRKKRVPLQSLPAAAIVPDVWPLLSAF